MEINKGVSDIVRRGKFLVGNYQVPVFILLYEGYEKRFVDSSQYFQFYFTISELE